MKFLLFNVIVMGAFGYLYVAETGKDPSRALQNVQRAAAAIVTKHVGPATAPTTAPVLVKPVQPAKTPVLVQKVSQEPHAPSEIERLGNLKPAPRPAPKGKIAAKSALSPIPVDPESNASKTAAPRPTMEQKSASPAPVPATPVVTPASPARLADDVALMKPAERQRQLDSLIGDMERLFVDRLAK